MIQPQESGSLLGEFPNWIIVPTSPFQEAWHQMYLGFYANQGITLGYLGRNLTWET